MNRIIPYAILTLVCIGSILAATPQIDRNVNDPNLIAYFNHDEGFLMDHIWYYYSGKKNVSFQYEADYGLELLYLSDLSRFFLSRFVDFTPGIFVLLLRWLHLIFWVGSMLILWRLVRHHFGSYWGALLPVILLAISPAFAYLSQNLKPEPVVLFFMIFGMDYILRIIEKPSWMNLAIAVSCASIATLIKFAGIFLLPGIIAAMYFGEQNRPDRRALFSKIKIAWALPELAGSTFITLPLALIFFYVRQSTGVTWYEQFGFWNSIWRSSFFLSSLAGGILLIILPFILWILNQKGASRLKNTLKMVSLFFSFGAIVSILFILFSLVFGFKWVANPAYFIQTLATTGKDALVDVNSLSGNGLLFNSFELIMSGIKEFGLTMLMLFLISLFIEVKLRREILNLDFLKCVTLVVVILSGMVCIFLPVRFVRHHMLPFFVASSILTTQGIKTVHLTRAKQAWKKNILLSLIGILLVTTIIQHVNVTARSFAYMYRWREDVVFDIAKWWRAHYSPDTSIVTDHPVNVYLPSEYKNAAFLRYQKDKVEQLRELVKMFKPKLVYYNTGVDVNSAIPPLEEILPDTRVRLVASFANAGKYYKRHPGSRYVIYEIETIEKVRSHPEERR